MQLNQVLSQEEINSYKSQGYTEEEIAQAITELQQEESDKEGSILQQSYQRANQSQQQDARSMASQTLISGGNSQDNLIKWQLELDSILERVEHMLRGDKPQFVQGNLIFMPPSSEEERIFTDFGIGEIMRILSMYLNRNTILSNYDEPTINTKVFDFGTEVADLIFLKYELVFASPTMSECFKKVFRTDLEIVPIEKDNQVGADAWAIRMKDNRTGIVVLKELNAEQMKQVLREFKLQQLEKRKLYPMIVRELVDAVHSAYLRALNGGERQSLHEQRSVSQQETIMPQGMGFGVGGQPVMRQRSILNPLRWFGGKYK